MSKQDIDKLEKLFGGLKEIVSIGEKVLADGKVGFEDSVHVPALFEAVKQVAEAAKEYKELGEEIKDLDGQEAIKLLSQILA